MHLIFVYGEVVTGHYVLTESGAASASHQATNGFAETEGYPVDVTLLFFHTQLKSVYR